MGVHGFYQFTVHINHLLNLTDIDSVDYFSIIICMCTMYTWKTLNYSI